MTRTKTAAAPVESGTRLHRREALIGGLLALGSVGCAYILHPERNGRRGGHVDIGPLIVDILWFIPGLIPGLICIVVDFATGCIYGGGRVATTPPLLAPDAPAISSLEVHVDGEVVASGSVSEDGTTRLKWNRTIDEVTLRTRARMTAQRGDGALAEAPMHALI